MILPNTMDRPLSIRAGLILTNDKNEYLVVKDTRSHKWSFPKGGKEAYDQHLTNTAEREMFEETGFLNNRDYTYEPINHVRAVVQTKTYVSLYYFFIGKCIKNDLYFTMKLDEHIEDVMFVKPCDLIKLDLNYVTKRAFLSSVMK